MISQFRKYTDSWIARIFFFLMAFAFVGWGVSGDLLRLMGPPSWVAKVGGQTIEVPAFQTEFQRAMAQQTRNMPSGQEPSADMRRQVGQETLDRMIAQMAIAKELADLRIVTPDQALAQTVRAMPAFRGSNGQFDKATFDSVLANNGYNEARFLTEMRADVTQRQLLATLASSVAAPDAETTPLYVSEFEKRAADTALFALSAAPEPPTPTDAQVNRWYLNHPDNYKTPEYRRIKAIELSPQSLASEINISDEELRSAYEAHKSEFVSPEKRSAEVISAPDEAKASALAAKWRGGADWTAMQAAATADGAAGITQDDATQVQFPDPDLAKAVFSAPADTVSQPIKGQLGWFVVRVTKITPGSATTFDQAKDKLRQQALASKAADMMYDRANKLDNLLGNGTPLDNLPGDLGVVGVAGTLDADGETPAGTPAPIPGPQELRKAIIAAAFQAHQGDQAQLVEVQTPSTGGSAYYALTLESIIPPGKKPFDEVKQQVADDWKQDQRHHFEDQAATAMMTSVQDGKSFSDAATIAGVTPKLTPLVTRDQPNPDVAPLLQRVMFGMKKNEATMVDVPQGFVVAQLVEIVRPDPAADKLGYDQARAALTKSISSDMAAVFVNAVRQRANPQINHQVFNSVVQPQ